MEDTKYSKIVRVLKSDILAGKYGANVPLPSERVIAARFGVSRPTVRQAIQTLRLMGLVKPDRGRGTFLTARGASRKIGLMLTGFPYSEFFEPMVTAFTDLARKMGYTLVFGGVRSLDPQARIAEAREIIAQFAGEQVAGVIYHPLDYAFDSGEANRRLLAELDGANIPVVLFDSDVVLAPERSAYDLVSIDNCLAGETLARHLIERGARNIHFLLKPNWIANALNRVRGAAYAVVNGGGRWSRENVLVSAPDDLARIRACFRKRNRPDAFICENDSLAANFLKSLERLGLSVPGDVLLAGFDDQNIARLLTPSLTSIHQPCADIAAATFHRLLRRIAQPSLPPQEIFLHAPLVTRSSTDRGSALPARKSLSRKMKERSLK